MNSPPKDEARGAGCHTLPFDVIASDKHKKDDVCYLVTEKTSAPARADCPVSKTPSRNVQRTTLEHLLKPDKAHSIQNVQYYFCSNPNCPVVYFPNEKAPYFTTDDVQVKVLAKDEADDVNVCYCFDWTRGRIKEEIAKSGKSTATLEIAREIKAGHCACDIKNPKGECCLGDVNRVVKEALARPVTRTP